MGVLRGRFVSADRESWMRWRVMAELTGMDGTVHTHEVSVGGATTIEHSSATIGLTLADGKRALAGLQGPFCIDRLGAAWAR
jgi:hypothetical protein